MKEKTIEAIVRTYNLPVKKRNKIISIAIQQSGSFEGFSDAYEYINFLVERFHQTPYAERFFTKLDHLVRDNSNTKFHELIYILDYLEEDNQRDLKTKLKNLKQKGQSILGRPIVQIEPFIKFGRRKYNKNPLALFREHKFYENKTRTQLFKIDSGMYEALRRHNQLHLAIPNIISPGFTTKISDKKEKEIIKIFQTLTSPSVIARKLKVTRATIDYYAKKHKLRKLNNKTGVPGYPKQMIKDVIECLKKCKIASKVARCYDISIRTVIKHGREMGVPILSRGGNRR